MPYLIHVLRQTTEMWSVLFFYYTERLGRRVPLIIFRPFFTLLFTRSACKENKFAYGNWGDSCLVITMIKEIGPLNRRNYMGLYNGPQVGWKIVTFKSCDFWDWPICSVTEAKLSLHGWYSKLRVLVSALVLEITFCHVSNGKQIQQETYLW